MSCRHKDWREGRRTYSDYVPGYARGAYFPGDEPGYTCEKYGCECGDPDEDMPEACLVQDDTGWFCPECAQEGLIEPLRRNARGVVNCACGHNFGDCREAPQQEADCEAL